MDFLVLADAKQTKDGGAQGPKIAPLILNMTHIFMSRAIFETIKKRYGITAGALISENSEFTLCTPKCIIC